MIKEKLIWLQIPTEIVRNIGFNVDEKSFAVYAYLLYQKFRSHDKNNNVININHNKMKDGLGITDNRTIKNSFNILHNQGLIKEKVIKLPINKELKVTLLRPYDDNWFTQLPLNLNLYLDRIGLIGYRLMYYYESYINRNVISKDYCFPSYETILSDLKISDKTLTRYNNRLKKEKLISITKHQVHFDNPFDDNIFDKYNNHYRVNLFNIK
ncbi:hypothetical protein ACQKNX_08000 [Lysinibacillus sp. NPDC093712]|uniref:hypothetical protein n=1 Tax=Lysinibacillus sp. NPDC093712 TaxID=3390579 RepID=UPI003D03A682